MNTPEHIETLHMFRHAEDLWQLGLNPLPVLPGKKCPAVRWKRYQGIRVTMEDLRRWWIEMREKNYAIGTVTGAIAGITVYDFEHDAIAEARAFYRENVTGVISRTGSDGIHLFYDYTPGGNRAKIGGNPVDVRNDGGFIMLPPSPHPTGQPYAWIRPPVSRDQLGKLNQAQEPQTVMSTCKQVQNGVAYISKIHATAGKGGHNQTIKAAIRLAESGMSEVEILAALVEWSRTNAHPEWTVQELTHKAVEGYRIVIEKGNQQLALADGCRDGSCDIGGRMQ